MMNTSSSGYIFPPEHFTGELAIGEHRVPITLTASVGPSGNLELEVEPISLSDCPSGVGALKRTLGRPGDTNYEFGFDGQTTNGKKLTSNAVYLVGQNDTSDGLHIKLRTREATLTMMACESHARPKLCCWLLGFKCYPKVHTTSGLGSVVVQGEARTTSTDEITGWIGVEGLDDSDPTPWRESAEHMLKHLRSVLDFARGARLPAPITKFYEGDSVEVTFRETSGGYAPMLPPISHLDLKQIVTTTVSNIGTVDDYREAFKMAIDWLSVPTNIDEIWFLSGMTALESVASLSLEKPQKIILSNSKFKKFAKRVRKFIDDQEDLDDPTREAIKGKIPELNRRSFFQQLKALLEHWDIARTSLGDEELKDLINLRNKIVHRGTTPEQQDIWPSILVVREIVVRLVLSMLQFEGFYQCYIGGRHMRRFPECKPVD